MSDAPTDYATLLQRLEDRTLDADLIADIEAYRAHWEKQTADNIIALVAHCEARGLGDIGKQLHGVYDDLYTGKP